MDEMDSLVARCPLILTCETISIGTLANGLNLQVLKVRQIILYENVIRTEIVSDWLTWIKCGLVFESSHCYIKFQ